MDLLKQSMSIFHQSDVFLGSVVTIKLIPSDGVRLGRISFSCSLCDIRSRLSKCGSIKSGFSDLCKSGVHCLKMM